MLNEEHHKTLFIGMKDRVQKSIQFCQDFRKEFVRARRKAEQGSKGLKSRVRRGDRHA